MGVKEITSRKIWDSFVTSYSEYTFLQSWSWGEFNQKRGEKVWRLGLYNGAGLVGTCQVVTVTAKRGRFLFVPHGTVVNSTLIRYIAQLAKQNNCSFLRFSPWIERSDKNLALFRELGFGDAPTIMHTEETWLVPIGEPEEVILAKMRKTHRNLIRRGEKDGVKIEISGKISDIQMLHDLQMKSVERHRFVPFSRKYLEDEFKTFSSSEECLLFLGKFRGETLAAALIIFYGKFAYYLQSGSQATNVPVNYVLQWEVIKEAKKRGCQFYNMWGVSAENRTNEGGLLMFKSGFGGFQKNYLHAQDLVFSPKYWITYILEKVPRRWRAKF